MNRVCACVLIFCWWAIPAAAQEGDFQKGLSYYKQKQYQRAIEEFEKIVQQIPDYESGHRILGDCYLQTREYDKAVESFREALRLKNENYVSYYGLALAYFNSQRFGEALETLDEGEKYARSPRDRYQLYKTRGSTQYNLERFDRAISDLEKAISIQRGNPAELVQLGIAYFRTGRYSKAAQVLEQAVALDPGSPSAAEYLGRIRYREGLDLLEEGTYDEAASLLRGYVRDHTQDGVARFNLGLALLFAGDLEGAEKEFRQCTLLRPDHWQAFQRLGYIHEKQRSYQKALDSYRRAQSLQPSVEGEENVERVEERIRREDAS